MILKKSKTLPLVLALALMGSNLAVAKNVVKEPTGAERAKQYDKVVRDCQKRFGGQSRDVRAEWVAITVALVGGVLTEDRPQP